jgi:hypothetical protein
MCCDCTVTDRYKYIYVVEMSCIDVGLCIIPPLSTPSIRHKDDILIHTQKFIPKMMKNVCITLYVWGTMVTVRVDIHRVPTFTTRVGHYVTLVTSINSPTMVTFCVDVPWLPSVHHPCQALCDLGYHPVHPLSHTLVTGCVDVYLGYRGSLPRDLGYPSALLSTPTRDTLC